MDEHGTGYYRILSKKIEDAQKYSLNVRQSQIKFVQDGIKDTHDFYYRLALISASAITFSVTFVSYISTTNNLLLQTWLLILSWVSFISCMFGSLYGNHFHRSFLHYQIQKQWLISKIEIEELSSELMQKYPDTVYNSFDGIDNLIKVSDERKLKYSSARDLNQNKELFYEVLWTYCLKFAHIGLYLGIVFMISFAAVNLK
jgi:hypothetical protein